MPKLEEDIIYLLEDAELGIELDLPWGISVKDRKKAYQCYCTLVKNSESTRDPYGLCRTTLTNGKLLPYLDRIDVKFENGLEFLEEISQTQIFVAQYYKLHKTSLNGQFLKTFQLNYHFPLSRNGKNILNSFTNKYIYYAIDDILYLLDSDPIERDNLLGILYSCMLSLQNEFSVNFFDIWIDSVYFNDNSNTNRFVKSQTNQTSKLKIAVKLMYFKRIPIKKPEPIW